MSAGRDDREIVDFFKVDRSFVWRVRKELEESGGTLKESGQDPPKELERIASGTSNLLPKSNERSQMIHQNQ